MVVEFERHTPENLSKEARSLLEEAAKESLLFTSCVDDLIYNCKTKNIHIYTLDMDGELNACFCVTIQERPNGNNMNMLLLGGKNVSKWRKEFVEFLEALAQKNEVTYFTMNGPLAWCRLFPEISLLTCVFGKKPKYLI